MFCITVHVPLQCFADDTSTSLYPKHLERMTAVKRQGASECGGGKGHSLPAQAVAAAEGGGSPDGPRPIRPHPSAAHADQRRARRDGRTRPRKSSIAAASWASLPSVARGASAATLARPAEHKEPRRGARRGGHSALAPPALPQQQRGAHALARQPARNSTSRCSPALATQINAPRSNRIARHGYPRLTALSAAQMPTSAAHAATAAQGPARAV